MSGAFAMRQPRYAETGISTLTVDAVSKKPSVKKALKGHGSVSQAWVKRFPVAAALGFACGGPSGLMVLDIDTPDENLLAELLDRLLVKIDHPALALKNARSSEANNLRFNIGNDGCTA